MNEPMIGFAHEPVATSNRDARITTLLDRMTLAEMVSLLAGQDFWSVNAIPRLGIGRLRVTDGPNGARGSGSLVGGTPAAAFPVGIALGATWDIELVRDIGQAIAQEAKSKGAHVLLAPTVNLHRSVTNGRNFECYAEDPILTSAIATSYIQGVQSEGIAATIKHFVGNESEMERTTINSEIDERTLREVYLRPFEDAVKKADVWALMSSYNKLNGTYTAENKWLLTDVLRDDWGFNGVVMSDWFGSRTTAPTINAGLDMEMPGPTRDRGEKLIAAVSDGEISTATVRERARAMLRLMDRVGTLDPIPPFEERADDRSEHRALIRRVGAAETVLLQNNGVLPLAAPTGKIAAIGPNAKVAQIMGGGSSQLNAHYRVSPFDGLVNHLGPDAIVFAAGCQNHRWEPLLDGHFDVEFFASQDLSGAVVATDTLDTSTAFWVPPFANGKLRDGPFSARVRTQLTAPESGVYSFGLHAAGRARLSVNGTSVIDIWDSWTRGRTFFEEGSDEVTSRFSLIKGETYAINLEFASVPPANLVNPAFRFGVSQPLGDAAIQEAVSIAQTAETAILFVGRSGEWDTEGSDLDGIRLPGRQDQLIRAVSAVNPRTVVVLQTGGPVEMPWVDDVAAIVQAWYPGQEAGNSITDVLFGMAEPGGRLPQTFPRTWRDNPTGHDDPEIYPGHNGNVRYDEGVFIGHRHYDANNILPLFAFGHGLTYTEFEVEDFEAVETVSGFLASATIRNIGTNRGTAVAQLYVGDTSAIVSRPPRELKGFSKVLLDPGEKKRISLPLDTRDFAYFDVISGSWRVEGGVYSLWLGLSATDLRAKTAIRCNAKIVAKETGAAHPHHHDVTERSNPVE